MEEENKEKNWVCSAIIEIRIKDLIKGQKYIDAKNQVYDQALKVIELIKKATKKAYDIEQYSAVEYVLDLEEIIQQELLNQERRGESKEK